MTKAPTNDTEIQDSDRDLDVFFAAARQDETRLSTNLMTAILGDAADQQPGPEQPARVKSKVVWWQNVLLPFRNWQAAGTLAACAVIGLVIGYAAPDSLYDISDLMFNIADSTNTDTIFTLDDLLAES